MSSQDNNDIVPKLEQALSLIKNNQIGEVPIGESVNAHYFAQLLLEEVIATVSSSGKSLAFKIVDKAS